MTRKQRNKLNRYNQSIAIQERTLATLQSFDLVVDNGATVALTERIIATLKSSRTSFCRSHGV